MARFRFREGFWLLLDNNITDTSRVRFEAGEQDVPDDLADHWFLAEMGERIDVATSDASEPTTDEREVLRAEAEALGIKPDKRWGVDRLKAEIEASKAAASSEPTTDEPPTDPVLGDAPPAAPITPDPESPAE